MTTATDEEIAANCRALEKRLRAAGRTDEAEQARALAENRERVIREREEGRGR